MTGLLREDDEAFPFGCDRAFVIDEKMFLEFCEEDEVVVEYGYLKDIF